MTQPSAALRGRAPDEMLTKAERPLGYHRAVSCRRDVIDAVVEVTGLDPEKITDDATLEELEVDSLDLIEIGMIIEQAHAIEVNGDDFEGVVTFGDAVGVFDRAISARQG
jgi:acyl carrier protein